jgi:hypothetical protein
MRLAVPVALALVACAGPRATAPSLDVPSARQPSLASSPDGRFETGRLTAREHSVAGPFVLTYVSPGVELEVVSAAADAAVIGRIAGALAQPLHVAAGTLLRLPGAGEALYAGYRPMPITRALDAYLGRQILVVLGAGQAEAWSLRQIGGDHLTLERSRTYRVVPVRRIAEITWTDLSGIDPTPRLVLAPE